MTETEKQFREELQELLDRYKNSLSNPQIMRIAQPIFTKTIGIRDNPERCNINVSKYGSGLKCSAQMIAEADCDGDARKCDNVCYKGEFRCID